MPWSKDSDIFKDFDPCQDVLQKGYTNSILTSCPQERLSHYILYDSGYYIIVQSFDFYMHPIFQIHSVEFSQVLFEFWCPELGMTTQVWTDPHRDMDSCHPFCEHETYNNATQDCFCCLSSRLVLNVPSFLSSQALQIILVFSTLYLKNWFF